MVRLSRITGRFELSGWRGVVLDTESQCCGHARGLRCRRIPAALCLWGYQLQALQMKRPCLSQGADRCAALPARWTRKVRRNSVSKLLLRLSGLMTSSERRVRRSHHILGPCSNSSTRAPCPEPSTASITCSRHPLASTRAPQRAHRDRAGALTHTPWGTSPPTAIDPGTYLLR